MRPAGPGAHFVRTQLENMNRYLTLTVALLVSSCAGAGRDDANVYTLYRSSAVAGDPTSRYQVATFDAPDPPPYNKQNCEIVAQLWKESGVQVRYWCERGRFHL